MSSSHVIFVNRFFYPDHSATSQIMADLAFHLASRGIRVSVITSRGLYDNPDANLPVSETKNGVDIHRVYRPRFGRDSLAGRVVDYLAMYQFFAAAAWRLAAQGDFVIVKTDPPLLSVALAPIVRIKQLRLINWLQDLYPELAVSLGMRAIAPISPLLRAARNASLKTAECNVVIGDHMRHCLVEANINPSQVEIIPNWCDDELIKPLSPENNPLRADWNLEKKFVVGYSGNLGRAHEYHTLIDAAERLREERDIAFLFIGGGHLTSSLKAEVKRRGLGHIFHFRQYQSSSNLSQSLSVPDVHWVSLLPKMEGLIVPSKFYGASAAGRPTIAVTDPDGEIARVVIRHRCGAVVAPGDDRALAAVIYDLKTDRVRLEQLGLNARALVDQAFSKKIALGRWEKLLMQRESEYE
jgi:glycosyltransferase involved in cell wall biosynthesis